MNGSRLGRDFLSRGCTRGCAIEKGFYFPDFGIKNGLYLDNFGIRNGTDFQDLA